MNQKKEYVIKKPNGILRNIWHFIAFAILWAFVIFIIIVNFGFIFHYYSDSMVTFYLLLNLDKVLYLKLAIAVFSLTIIMIIYCIFRFRSLRRNKDETKHS